ncbi:DUF1622 domain-containing protein [Lactococcus insecticola]|uniref:Membrane protein n=1 Tax=Pseudolactococcus insecticola TaxID=2709158 RepID=A0A6A0B785_9LACT|nr:DUF1622 domain-containing protein [Lactococcus insecticola]GFH40338.1 membrane protein [Lactococcus insecticola]
MPIVIADILEFLIAVTSLVAVIILICGIVKAVYKFVKNELADTEDAINLRLIKNELGAYVLLSLEILIAADIIESIVRPTFSDIGKLAALVVIRTVISYFLGQEIDQENKR